MEASSPSFLQEAAFAITRRYPGVVAICKKEDKKRKHEEEDEEKE